MAEDVMEKKLEENASKLAKAWYKGDFDIGHYNFFICTTTEGMIQNCKEEHSIEVKPSEIEDMCKLDLLEYILDKKDGKKMFPQFIADRAAFIKRLQAKFNYPASRLQQIIAYENELLPYSNEACNFYYADRKNVYSWLIERINFAKDGVEEYLRFLKMADRKYSGDIRKKKHRALLEGLIKKTEEDLSWRKKFSASVSKRKWKNLSEDEKQALITFVFNQQVSDEHERISSVAHYYNKILNGYGPQVEFKDPKPAQGKLHFELIDWDETMDNVYKYNRFIDFFITPYFSIELNGKEVVIKIIEPSNVDNSTMRNIEKMYTIFKGRLGRKRKKWGEVSGRRLLIEKRDEELRRLYSQWRKEKPNVASSRWLEQLEAHSQRLGMPVRSIERIKRILYSRDKS